MKEIKLKIQYQTDREKIVQALANNGYKVHVKEEHNLVGDVIYYVIFDL